MAMKKRAILIAFLAISVQLAQVETTFGQDLSKKKRLSVLSEQWLTAVAMGDLQTALTVAGRIISTPSKAIPQKYIRIYESEKVKNCFLTAPFDRWDFQLWQDAYFFKQLSEKITKGDPDNVKAMFAAVRKRIAPHEGNGGGAPPRPYQVWKRGFGVCDRQAWILCELAYQAGWESQVIYLRDPKTQVSPHTVCELRREDGSVYFADPYGDVLLPKWSVGSVAVDQNILQAIWPERPEWRNALQDCQLLTPSYAQDYRAHNQELYKILKDSLKSRCPRFGVAPEERMAKYRELRLTSWANLGSSNLPFSMDFWWYPLRLLRGDIKHYADQGHSLYLEGKYDEAISHYEESKHIKPSSAIVEYEWGDALERKGRFNEAIDHYHEALTLKPGFSEAREHLIRVLHEANEKKKPVSKLLFDGGERLPGVFNKLETRRG